MILVIDNYDSFTYNLVQYIGEFIKEIRVVKNDQIKVNDIDCGQVSHIILSPGPHSPSESGICMDVIKSYYKKIPILGVCLGHQSIAQAFGAKIINSDQVVHGKTSTISHINSKIFSGVPTPFEATRYHSLIVDPSTLDSRFIVNSYLENFDIIMGIEHKKWPLIGLQFHPESIKTDYGKKIIQNFINNCIIQ